MPLKLIPPVLILICFLFSGCNHHPTHENQETALSVDESQSNVPDSIMLKEPIVNSVRHYFSDTTDMDSFAVEMPAGNILKNDMVIRIYSNQSNLLFTDSISASDFIEDAVYNTPNPQPEVALIDLRRGIKNVFKGDVFAFSGNTGAIKNASGKQIANMVGWNEAVDDSTKIVFTFSDSYRGNSYVAYSQKLKKAVVIVRTAAGEEEGEGK